MTSRVIEMHLEIPDAEPGRLGDTAAPYERANAGEKFRKGERLDEVVVGAGVESDDAVLQRVTGRQHEDGRLHATFAHRQENLDTVAARQREIEQHGVEGLGRDAKERTFPRVLDDHVVPFALEPLEQGVGDFLFVLDNQDSHPV